MDLWVRTQDKRGLYCVRQLRVNGFDVIQNTLKLSFIKTGIIQKN